MRFLVVGTGRCGTTWLSEVLTAAGVPTGHEDVFTAVGIRDMWCWLGEDGKVHSLAGDVSLYAVPFLREWDGPVLHMVRHPLDCIGSLAGWRLPSFPNTQGEGGQLVNAHLPWTCSDQITASARYWHDWNVMAERGADYLRFRVEDATPTFLADLMRRYGHDVDVEALELAVAARSAADYRIDSLAPIKLGWPDIPETERRRVRLLAERYGYDV